MRNEAVKPCPQRLSRRFNHKDVDDVMLDSHGFTLFPFFSIYYMDTIHITSWKKGIYDTIIPFTFHLAYMTPPKGGLDGWWPTLGLCSSLSTDQWLQWCHRCLGASEPADWPTDSTDLGLSYPSLGQGGRALFLGGKEVKRESWRLGGGK